MKKIFAAVAMIAMFIVMALTGPANAAAEKISICHSGNGKHYTYIEPSVNGYNGHKNHKADKFGLTEAECLALNGPVVDVPGDDDTPGDDVVEPGDDDTVTPGDDDVVTPPDQGDVETPGDDDVVVPGDDSGGDTDNPGDTETPPVDDDTEVPVDEPTVVPSDDGTPVVDVPTDKPVVSDTVKNVATLPNTGAPALTVLFVVALLLIAFGLIAIRKRR